MFDKMTSAGISFYITDNTNGLPGVRNTWDSTQTLAALTAREYRGRLRYALMVGVNPCGPYFLPAALTCMERELQLAFDTFLNTTDAAARAIDGNGGAAILAEPGCTPTLGENFVSGEAEGEAQAQAAIDVR